MPVMKIAILLLLFVCVQNAGAQRTPVSIELPSVLKRYGQEFSGMCISNQKLFLLPQLADIEPETVGKVFLYTVSLSDIAACTTQLSGCERPVSVDSIELRNLQTCIQKIGGNHYEGLEAIAAIGNHFYFTVETKMKKGSKIPFDEYYILKGILDNNACILTLDANSIALNNWLKQDPYSKDKRDYEQVGPEAIAPLDTNGNLLVILEYNKPFEKNTQAYQINPDSQTVTMLTAINPVDFRITDLTNDSGALYALNFYYGGEWEIYARHKQKNRQREIKNRVDPFDSERYNDKTYTFGRILKLDTKVTPWKWVSEVKIPFREKRNWEGLVKFGNGFLILSDDNKGANGLQTELVYIELPTEKLRN